MPEPFKTFFNVALIERMGAHLAARDPAFDRAGFVTAASDGLDDLELKARSQHIADALEAHLPQDFAAACTLMVAALHPETEAPVSDAGPNDAGIRGWAVMPMAEVVARRGAIHLDRSMATLAEMTTRFTAEFAIRPFLAAEPERAMAHMHCFSRHPNAHVRRLASEGSRPRLPWGMRLTAFVADPAPLIPLLERLRDDPSDYVRRSVANSLNDIAKDHPDLVATLAKDWLAEAPPERARLIRHACRSLIKAGHPATLAALGYATAQVKARVGITTPVVRYSGALDFAVELRSVAPVEQRLVVDYAIHFRKANGTTAPKVFKLRSLNLPPGETVRIARRHAIRPITTRRYYDGAHRLEILVNGTAAAEAPFTLKGAG